MTKQTLAVISPEGIFRNGVRGSMYVAGEQAAKAHSAWVLSQFPVAYNRHIEPAQGVVEMVEQAAHVKKIEYLQALMVYVTPQNLDLIEPLIARQHTKVIWLLAEPVGEAMRRLTGGASDSVILSVDRSFASHALSLMLLGWLESAVIAVPHGVKQIRPALPMLPQALGPVASLC